MTPWSSTNAVSPLKEWVFGKVECALSALSSDTKYTDWVASTQKSWAMSMSADGINVTGRERDNILKHWAVIRNNLLSEEYFDIWTQ